MSGLLAITARELRLRWTLLPVALSLGLVPLLAPVLAPVLGFALPAPGLVGLVLSLLMGTLAALLTGASVIGGDLGSRRLGFFFSRPVREFLEHALEVSGVVHHPAQPAQIG